MKKILLVLTICSFATIAKAQIEQDSSLFLLHVENACHATMSIVKKEMKVKEVKKYRSSDIYSISFDGVNWSTYAPIKGEQMLSYEGKYFYSITRKALVKPALNTTKNSSKKERTPEEKMIRQQQVNQLLAQAVNIGQQVIYRSQQRRGW